MRNQSKNSKQRGDTIVEVMLSMALLTSVLFTSWGAVNRATQVNQASRKRIDMVNQLKEQAEILKAKRSSYQANPNLFEALFSPYADSSGLSPNPCDDITSSGNVFSSAPTAGPSFYFAKNVTTQSVSLTANAKAVQGNASSLIWIQRITGSSNGGRYIDFYVRGCWLTNGGVQKLDNSQLLVRINL